MNLREFDIIQDALDNPITLERLVDDMREMFSSEAVSLDAGIITTRISWHTIIADGGHEKLSRLEALAAACLRVSVEKVVSFEDIMLSGYIIRFYPSVNTQLLLW